MPKSSTASSRATRPPWAPPAHPTSTWPPTTRPSRTRGASSNHTVAEVSIAVLYPELLGTYGDWGNAVVLAQRLRWRGIGADVVQVGAGQTAPTSCDIYVMGGGEDGPQALAARELADSGALHTAVEAGAVVFGVCAGIQILG